jgi:hypothetical protein
MYTLEFLIPTALAVCFGGAMNNIGPCAIDKPGVHKIRYYEPGKSCYVNGTFYTKCEDRLNGTK